MAGETAAGRGAAAPSVRLLSYNIHRAVGADGIRKPERIAAIIAQCDCEIVGLQEVDWQAGGEPPSEAFLESFAGTHGYQLVKGPNMVDHRGHYGNILLTRLPILATRLVDLGLARREPRSAIDTTVRTAFGALRIMVTHFGLGWRERRYQAQRIAHRIDETPTVPCAILGDFNEWVPLSPALRPLMRRCAHASAAATYPARRPLLRLDRILLAGFSDAVSMGVVRNAQTRNASDHLPVRARLWRDGARRCA